jgi:hypothetical protein
LKISFEISFAWVCDSLAALLGLVVWAMNDERFAPTMAVTKVLSITDLS